MVIRRMTATFGCLDGAVLALKDGLQLISLPNESGKSTWTAFILAMFYGIETSERSAKGRIPAKIRYQPWNGKPMAGKLELEFQGRNLVLERTSLPGKPLSVLRVYDQDTGLDLPQVCAENCGIYFLGVERSVFTRSALLTGEELTVTEDGALARRLENLATTGTSGDNYLAAQERLKRWLNRCDYRGSGLLPDAQQRLRQIEQSIRRVEDLRGQRLTVAAQLEQANKQRLEEEQVQQQLWQAQCQRLTEAAADAESQARQLQSQVAGLPTAEALRKLLTGLQAQTGQLPQEQPCPQVLKSLAVDEIFARAQEDLAQYQRLTVHRRYPWRGWLLVAGCLLLAAMIGLCAKMALSAGLLGVGLLCALLGIRNWKNGKKHDQATAILERYGADSEKEIISIAVARQQWLTAQENAARQNWAQEVLIQEVMEFAPEVTGLAEAIQAATDALQLQKKADTAMQRMKAAQHDLQIAVQPRNFDLEERREREMALRLQTEKLRVEEQMLGDWEQLMAQKEQIQQEIQQYTQHKQALQLAQTALQNAHRQLEQRYAPQLTTLTGNYLQRLTENRYHGVILERDMHLLVREQESGLTRPLESISRGTQDQAWLALRLAMTRLLLPEETPLLLDDVLLTFDPVRTRCALAVLEQEHRQILVFSCQ